MVEELAQHAAASFEAARADGLSADEAERHVRALIDAWCADASRYARRPRRPPLVEPPSAAARGWTGLLQDLRYSLRLAARQPGFTAIAVVLVALGIAAATTLGALTYAVLIKPLAWPEADRLIAVIESREGASRQFPNIMTNATYLAWRESPETIESLAGYVSRTVTVTGDTEPERIRIVSTTADLFPMLRARPVAGTLFTTDDEATSWQRRFGLRGDIVGKTIDFDGEPFRILAVMPNDFAFPTRDVQAWTPFHVTPVIDPSGANPQSRSVSLFRGLARLKPGATASQASAEATARGRAAPDLLLVGTAVFGTQGKPRVAATPYLEAQTAEVRPALIVLMAAVVLLLAVAVANIAGMQLARATSRRREMAIRSALGAGIARLTRQLLAENLVLGAAGGAIGWAFALALLESLPRMLPSDFPRTADIAADWRVLAFAFASALAASALFGAVPALAARRLNLVEALVEDNLAPIGGALRSHAGRLRAMIMAGQVAVAAILLIGAVLFGRSFVALLQVDRGYNPRNLLTATLPMPDRLFTSQQRAAALDGLVDRLEHTPGVIAAAGASVMPLLAYDQPVGFKLPRAIGAEPAPVQANLRTVSPDYFHALGMHIVEGRGLSSTDTQGSLPVVVVNRAFVRKYLPGPVLGVRLPISFNPRGTDWQEIVGVVDDVLHQSASDPAQPEIFAAYRQLEEGMRMNAPALVVRTAGDPSALAPVLRRLVHEQHPGLVIDSVMTMDDRLLNSLARPRLYTIVLVIFAGFAVLVAGAGLFSVLSYTVALRSREIGVRAALGARPTDIVRLVARQGLGMTVAGLTAGLLAASGLVTFVGKLLFGVTARDPLSFVLAPAIVLIVATLASLIPALRAARIDPLKALRQ